MVAFILTIRMQFKILEMGCFWHVKCYIGQSTHHPLIYHFNVETNKIFAFHHPIWMDLKKAGWTELQRLTLQLLSFIPLLFLNVFRVSVLEASTCIMMPSGNRFCLYSPWCSFEVFQVKGTKEALTIWHCFYCLTKEKMYFNFPRVSGMIKQAVFISKSHFQQTSNCEQRTVKIVLERNQHSSTQPAYVLLCPSTNRHLSVDAAIESSVYKSYTKSNGI